MSYELFIDNKKVDLSPSTNINLTYKSNLLSELDKITSSYSYTIKLPKTKRNMELIEGCNIPSNNSSFAYLQHRARLLRDGIEIVRDAVVALLSVGNDIQISLTWGNVSALADFVRQNKNLRDLKLGTMSWTIDDTEQTPSADYGKNVIFNQPVVKVKDVMTSINNESVALSIAEPTKIEDLVIPLINMAGSEEYTEEYNISGSRAYTDQLSAEVVFNGNGLSDSNSLFFSSIFEEGFSYIQRRTSNVKFTVNGWIDYIYRERDLNVEFYLNDGFEDLQYDETFIDEDRRKHYRFNIDKTYDTDKSVLFTVWVPDTVKRSGVVECSMSILSEATADIVLPEYDKPVDIDLASNMPDISQIDFLKAIMSMMGWYAEPLEDGNGIRMLPYSTITDNKGKAVDWSDKLANRRIEPSEIEFRISDMAQKNYFKYAEDKTVTGNYDGYIEIDDDTLEAENDVITLPFAGTDKSTWVIGGTTESIPLYTINENDEIEINTGLVPRILRLQGTKLLFDGLHWNELINKNWQAYKEIIRRPKIISEQVKLSAVDLKLVDMTIPVYFSQYGSYFAILEIKTMSNDMCDVQLLKI